MNAIDFLDPVEKLGGLLLEVDKPARYTGGEAGILAKRNDDDSFYTLIAFPDLYEIGMGNQALKIIYNRMNNMSGIVCDRAFAPAPDFEKLLREKNIPLYGLDTGISLRRLDLLMFTLGYELGLNGVLTMLDVSGIPSHCEERIKNKPRSFTNVNDPGEYPIVIAGGAAVSNPLPFSPFIDAFWIGEAEAGFFDLAAELAQLKKRGEGRADPRAAQRATLRAAMLEKISSHPNIWVRGKEKARRAVFTGFSQDGNAASVFPVPSMKIVHNHGAVEIMRGCPNGCRFCHAGYWYRPMRQKSRAQIAREVQDMVTKGGWREISLSSLSSGDYSGAGELVELLNQLFKNMHVSFQLPSLKVSSFSLALLEKISVTRKSGLTFAVETPNDMRQMAINKDVTRDSVVAILEEARKRGWRTAKFYFMIGLPVPSSEKSEEEEIAAFIIDVAKRVRMHFNINVGIFVPKAHTPYQWASQLDSASAAKKFEFIRSKLKPMGHKVSVSDPLISRIEGLLSRGDERAGLLCEEAYLGGSRLDAWNEYINKDKWFEILEENRDLVDNFLSGKEPQPWQHPWHGIDSCVTHEYLRQELEKSNNAQRTASCKEKCGLCGVCGKDVRVTEQADDEKNTPESAFLADGSGKNDDSNGIADSFVNYKNKQVNKEPGQKSDPAIYRVLFSFSKHSGAVFHGHLSLIEIFSMAFTRTRLPVMYTQGFNPLAKIEIASPLSTGVSADSEIAAADFAFEIPADGFMQALNAGLPQGVRIERTEGFHIPGGMKKHSLSSLLWGFAYAGVKDKNQLDYVKACEEKVYRQNRLEKEYPGLDPKPASAVFSLKRGAVLSRDITGKGEWASYFDVYRFLYPE